MQSLVNDPLVAPQQRRPFSLRRRAALFVALCLSLGLLAACLLPPAWQATQRREAYLPALEASARRHPDDGSLLALLAGRQMEAGEFPAAAETLKQAAAAGEQDETVWLALADATAEAGQPARALADLQLGLKNLPNSSLLHARLTEARSPGAASSPAVLARTISPQGPAPLLEVYARGSFLNGLSSWWARRHPAASGFATRQGWAAARPNDAEAQRYWGLALAQNRRLPEAEATLQRAVALAPQSPEAHLALADVLRRRGSLQRSAQEYVAALKLRSDWLPALMGLGASFQASGIPTYALQSYTRATQVAPRSADAWAALGSLEHMNDGLITESVASFRTAARLAPKRTDFLNDYAAALRLANQWDEAEAVLQRRLSQVPDDPYAHFLFGLILMDSRPTPERLTQAERHLRESLRLSPHNPVAEVQLADLCLDRGQGVEAVQLLSDALRRLPYERRAILMLSRAYQMTGQSELAAKVGQQAAVLQRDEDQASVLEAAKRDHTTDLPFHQRLADLYDRIGKPDKAARERLTIHHLQTGSQKALQSSRALTDAVDAVLRAH